MQERKEYQGTPDRKGDWDVKMAVIVRGKELTKSASLGQIKIHKKEGKIQTEHI